MKKVLIVEDDLQIQDFLQKRLAGQVQVLSALTIENARELFKSNPDIHIVVVDGCVPGEDINTVPLIHLMRKTFRGPMIACSGRIDYQQTLLSSGCNLKSEKENLPKMILGLLDESIASNNPNNPYDPIYLVDISGLDKAEVLVALYENADIYGYGFINPKSSKPLSIKEARKLIELKLSLCKKNPIYSPSLYYDVINGRAIKADIYNDIINVWLYNRENGYGIAQVAINKLRENPQSIIPSTKIKFKKLKRFLKTTFGF